MAEPQPFRPSVRQRRLAEAACSLAFSVQPRLVCAQAQIPHSTYYRWQKNPAFSAWLAATVLQCLAANSPFLLLNTLQAALTGDASARKLIFQFCIAPRLAPAMAALPAPGLEAFLGLPAAVPEAAPICPSPVPGSAPASRGRPANGRASSPPSAGRTAVPAAQSQNIPRDSESSAAVPAAKTNAPPAAEPTAPPINNQPPSSADPAAPCPSPVPNPSSQPSEAAGGEPGSPKPSAVLGREGREVSPDVPDPARAQVERSETQSNANDAPRSSSPRPGPRIAPMWRVNKEGKLEPLPRGYW